MTLTVAWVGCALGVLSCVMNVVALVLALRARTVLKEKEKK